MEITRDQISIGAFCFVMFLDSQHFFPFFLITMQISAWIFFSFNWFVYECSNRINSVNSYFEFRTSDKLSNSIWLGPHTQMTALTLCIQTYNDNPYNLHVLFRSFAHNSFFFSFRLDFCLWIFHTISFCTLCVHKPQNVLDMTIVSAIKRFGGGVLIV